MGKYASSSRGVTPLTVGRLIDLLDPSLVAFAREEESGLFPMSPRRGPDLTSKRLRPRPHRHAPPPPPRTPGSSRRIRSHLARPKTPATVERGPAPAQHRHRPAPQPPVLQERAAAPVLKRAKRKSLIIPPSPLRKAPGRRQNKRKSLITPPSPVGKSRKAPSRRDTLLPLAGRRAGGATMLDSRIRKDKTGGLVSLSSAWNEFDNSAALDMELELDLDAPRVPLVRSGGANKKRRRQSLVPRRAVAKAKSRDAFAERMRAALENPF